MAIATKYPNYNSPRHPVLLAPWEGAITASNTLGQVVATATATRTNAVLEGVFLFLQTDGYWDVATTGEAVTGYALEVFGTTQNPIQKKYLATTDAGYVRVLNVDNDGPLFMIGEDCDGGVISTSIVFPFYCDIINYTGGTATYTNILAGGLDSANFNIALPTAGQFLDSSSASATVGSLKFMVVGCVQDYGQTATASPGRTFIVKPI